MCVHMSMLAWYAGAALSPPRYSHEHPDKIMERTPPKSGRTGQAHLAQLLTYWSLLIHAWCQLPNLCAKKLCLCVWLSVSPGDIWNC